MIRETEVRLIVQNKPNTFGFTNLYYPAVISATTSDEIPFCTPTASIEIVSNSSASTHTYVSPIHEDDIVRLQVSERLYPDQARVWIEIFSGRIREIRTNYGTSNTTLLECVGHIEEAEWTIIQETKNYATPTDASTIISYFLSKYHRILEYSPTFCLPGVAVPTYDTTANQTSLSDLLTDLENISGNAWYADAVPIYNADQTLNTVYLAFKPLDDIVNDQYKAIEGTARYICSVFSSSIEDLITSYRVEGQAPADTMPASTAEGTPVTQPVKYSSTSSQSVSISNYGFRMSCDTYTWIKSDSQAGAVAAGVLSNRYLPIVSGSITLVGTPQAHKGDLVYVKLPSTEVNGAVIIATFSAKRVTHNISESTYTTCIEVGQLQKTVDDYIGKLATQTKILKKNVIGLR